MATTTKKATTKKAAVSKVQGVPIMLPKAERGSENFETASVNGKVYRIKRGEIVYVPEGIAEVLNNSFEAMEAADNLIESVTN